MDKRRRNAFANAMQLITQMENVSRGGGTGVMGSAIAHLTFVILVRKYPNSNPNIQAPPILIIQMENVSRDGGTGVMGSAIAPLTFVIVVRKHPKYTSTSNFPNLPMPLDCPPS